MLGRIFISYRRADSQYATDRIYERLAETFGEENVFMDIDDIPLGVNFRDYIDQQVSTSSIVLAVIGDHWLDSRDAEGNPRLQNPSDFVRLELEATFRLGIKLIPIFIGNVKAIQASKLPKSLQELPMLNATRIRRGQDFLPDVDRLIRGIEHISKEQDDRREKNKAALAELKQSTSAIKQQLSQFEALMIQEMRKRTRLEKQAQKLEAQVQDSMVDPGKQLIVDVDTLKQEIEKLNEGLYALALQVEARKQGKVIEDEPPLATEEADVEPEKPAPEPEKKLGTQKTARLKPDLKKSLAKIPVWGWGAALVLVLGVIFGPKLYQLVTTSIAGSQADAIPTLEPPAVSSEGLGAVTPEPTRVEPEYLSWIEEISNTTPDFIEDFSIPQFYWEQEGITQDSNNAEPVSEGVFRIVDDPSVETHYDTRLIESSDFLLQFEITLYEGRSGTVLIIKFRETYQNTYQFDLKPDGSWSLHLMGDEVENLASGKSNSLKPEQTAIIQVFAWNNQLSVLIDGEPLVYVEDDTISRGSIGISFISSEAIQIELDNIQVWDLTDLRMGETRQQDSNARAFYTPIREYLAITPPDFEEDFAIIQDYLLEMPVGDQRRSMNEFMSDGRLNLYASEEEGYPPLFSLAFPQMKSGIAALQFDFQVSQIDEGDGPHIYNHLDGDESQPGCVLGLSLFSESGRTKWTLIDPRMYNEGFLPEGNEPQDTYSYLVIFYDSQYAVFLNGQFLTFGTNLNISSQNWLHINFDSPGANVVEVSVDNIKYWDLTGYVRDLNGNSVDEEVSKFARQVLLHTNTQPPDFFEDFETPQAYWNTMRVDQTQNNRVSLSNVVGEGDGVAHIDSTMFSENPIVKFQFDQIQAGNFVYQFDFNPMTMQEMDELAIYFSEATASEGYNSDEYHFVISPYQEDKFTWRIERNTTDVESSPVAVVASGLWDYEGFLEGAHTLNLSVYQGQLLVLLDGKFVTYHSDLALAEADVLVYVTFDAPGPSMQFDDFKFWNLDMVVLDE